VAAGRVERLADFPSKHVPPRNVDVWLPDGYPKQAPYAVLYMQDGGGLFDATKMWNGQEWRVDETASKLIADGKVRPFIVVGVFNGGATRQSEYMPQKPFEAAPEDARKALLESKFDNGQRLYSGPVRSDAYVRFLVEELKPYIDAHYQVSAGPADTAVMGSSMGGMISLYAICEYPAVFGAAGAVSTHWPGGMSAEDGPVTQATREYLRKYLPDPKTHRIYFDHGTATLDAMYPALQRKVDAVMRERGYTRASWQTRVFEGAEHSENSWAERLAVPLEFLLPPR
jgi:enterochelin esterase-like enzyme